MKKFKFLKPELFKLEGEFFAVETEKGYKINLHDGWLGFTKPIVENCGDLFEYVGEIDSVIKKKRPRIKVKKVI